MIDLISKDLVLQTGKVLLRPMREADFDDFLKLSQQDTGMWEFFSKNLSDPKQLRDWITEAIEGLEARTRMPFTIISKENERIAGSMSLGNIAWNDQRLEIGWSWLGPAYMGSGINRNAKFAMIDFAFEVLHFERVEFKTGVLNLRARKGLEKIGGIEEGTLRAHSKLWNGKRRTSVFYSILRDEWPKLKTTIFADLTADKT